MENKYLFKSIINDGKFDSLKDLAEVKPSVQLSISEILQSGVVPSAASPDDFCSEVVDTDSICGRAQDVFEALHAQKYLIGKAMNQVAASTESGATVVSTPSE